MELQIKAFNEVITLYYELLEVVGTTPSLWNNADETLHTFPTDIEFVVDVEQIIKNNLSSNENYLIEEYFFFQDLLSGAQKIQFAGIQSRIGNIFIELEIYPASNYNRRNIN